MLRSLEGADLRCDTLARPGCDGSAWTGWIGSGSGWIGRWPRISRIGAHSRVPAPRVVPPLPCRRRGSDTDLDGCGVASPGPDRARVAGRVARLRSTWPRRHALVVGSRSTTSSSPRGDQRSRACGRRRRRPTHRVPARPPCLGWWRRSRCQAVRRADLLGFWGVTMERPSGRHVRRRGMRGRFGLSDRRLRGRAHYQAGQRPPGRLRGSRWAPAGPSAVRGVSGAGAPGPAAGPAPRHPPQHSPPVPVRRQEPHHRGGGRAGSLRPLGCRAGLARRSAQARTPK